jgi:broad specificity phosphatase PhoE
VSRVFLVRHAQASFLEPNYDQLSLTGQTQARRLGEYWTRHKIPFDRIGTGPRVRQVETAKIVRKAYQKAGLRFPEPVVMPEFDEYQGDAVLEQSLPRLAATSKEVRERHAAFQNSRSPGERLKNFQKMFEVVIGKWASGELRLRNVESWHQFRARVKRGLSRFLSSGSRGEQIAIFCSGGPIAIAMQHALHLSTKDTLQVMWMSRNSSYSEFLSSGDRFTLSTFNAFPHLDDASLLTYR